MYIIRLLGNVDSATAISYKYFFHRHRLNSTQVKYERIQKMIGFMQRAKMNNFLKTYEEPKKGIFIASAINFNGASGLFQPLFIGLALYSGPFQQNVYYYCLLD